MRNLKSYQRGLSFSSVMLMVALGAFFLTLAFKMGPAYLQYWQVRSTLDKLLEQPQLGKQGPRAILQAIEKQLYINEVRTVKSDSFDVKGTKDAKGWDVSANYVVQQHIGGNVDVLMTFDYSVVVPKNPQ
ncbi:DUF4845 domain-containing protein [Thiorhodovibrio frisius]|uniref:DUF4845 domain-containing protein n=1 Tax=Thiorhodovibrio frisius TaxID=631362 RepID=H8Z274_9GAMM|nr:DUF4845 domain-containing protein [Thiorhodovibrio frisius]EIC22636.1 hypothetical protein Thi970DRAFT_02914 [Thiorhodovibrio frisius]WPL22392.1 hypothetical protein Thiofri_02556 [Thiorhodovibrio frisius]